MPKKLVNTVAVILHRGNKVAISRRKTFNFKDYWQVAGGKVEKNETIFDAVRRELLEETGLKIAMERFYWTGNIFNDPSCYTCHVYKVELKEGEEPKNTEPEIQGPWRWVLTSTATKRKLMPGLKEIIRDKICKPR
jgi:8-oxo-dGTP diphosphatase